MLNLPRIQSENIFKRERDGDNQQEIAREHR
jgi:hypothetical protein